MIITIIIYWLATTIWGTYWLVKTPSSRDEEDSQYITLGEILGYSFLASLLAFWFVPMMILASIKFKR